MKSEEKALPHHDCEKEQCAVHPYGKWLAGVNQGICRCPFGVGAFFAGHCSACGGMPLGQPRAAHEVTEYKPAMLAYGEILTNLPEPSTDWIEEAAREIEYGTPDWGWKDIAAIIRRHFKGEK